MVRQPNNPTEQDRIQLLYDALKMVAREEDLADILSITRPLEDITTILPIGSLKGKKVGILGAGAAGLASAYELRKSGADITILEANPNRIGGRIYTHYFDETHYGELGAMRIPVAHQTTWHYIDELKLNTNPFIQNSEDNILYVKNERFIGLQIDEEVKRRLYPKFPLSLTERNTPLSIVLSTAYNQPIKDLSKEIRPLIIGIREKFPYPLNFYDNITFRKNNEYLNYTNAMNDLISRVIGTDSGFYYFSFMEILKEAYPASFVYLYEITGGTINLPNAFVKSFQTNPIGYGSVTLKLNERVKNIHEKGNQVFVQTQEDYLFDYVICTIPFSCLRLVDIYPLFSNPKMEAIREVNYSPSQKILCLFKSRFWEHNAYGGRAITDLAITSTWFPSHGLDQSGGVLVGSYSMNLDATRLSNVFPELKIEILLQQLSQTLGVSESFLREQLLDTYSFNWNRNDYSLGAFVKYYTEQNNLFAYASTTPEFHDKVFFAGEHVGPCHAWIQGALQSAQYAVNSLAHTVKIKPLL